MAPRGESPPRTRRDRDRTRERNRDRTRERERDRTRDRERDRTRERERERERDRYQDSDREQEREARREARRERRQSSAQPARRSRYDEPVDEPPRTRRHTRSGDGRRHSRARSGGLSAEALARQEREQRRQEEEERRLEHEQRRNARRQAKREQARPPREEYIEVPVERPRREKKGLKRRVVSGAVMEEGRARGYSGRMRGGAGTEESVEKEGLLRSQLPWWKRKRILTYIGISVVALIILIVVAVVVSNKNKSDDSASNGPSTSNLDNLDRNSIPEKYRGTDLDPWSWADTSGFNLTFTTETVGDLPVMGLFTDWDDSKAANDKVPPLNKAWGSYADRPARGVNVGGWLSLEPFITPSLFQYDAKMGIVDEYTLCDLLGDRAKATLEKHYAEFVTESTFRDIAAAGLDHVRIPFSYWAVEVYDGDPYVFRTSWRYLLRAIEWARKYGLRVNLDVHGLPGSQNGWNHSGRLGAIGWLNGASGDENAKRSLEMHDRLSKFFAQDRYKNIVAFYGLANEPKMTELEVSAVVSWTEEAYKLVRGNGVEAVVVFGDGFMGLGKWKGQLSGLEGLALDVHQYLIFNTNQVVYTHKKKVEYACDGWSKQSVDSMDTSTGFGPTLFAEWSQADTDCAKHLTNVGWGNRWEGTYDTGGSDSVLQPRCPAEDHTCSCAMANADPADYSSEYREFLKMFAEAQMHSFEKGWGWWYWTWKTESAAQWSYEAGLKAGILPEKAYERDFDCSGNIPDFEGLPEYY
ncbi:related to glucan 1,3-beta-glucosidase [Cephalotrichum gorgonifer]|uniref:glucan 1,3-beta-glucosidase n=1 Tax=Cephalotrichum gorgonifer TaxID=2041049 RepID=A0AAE8N239_9PEZI|nr:related to glucan 1,3-beta-glucosidase [Cephalotrichum gorgonifer]